jgi:hypothetical protein
MAGNGVGERVGFRVVRHGGTDLDARVRVATNNLRNVQSALERAEKGLANAVAHGEAEVARLRAELAERQALADALMEEKLANEPGTSVPGLKRPNTPPGLTPEEWLELRLKNEHLPYLRKAY